MAKAKAGGAGDLGPVKQYSARTLLGGIAAGARGVAGRARAFLSRVAGGGITAKNVGARAAGVRQRFGAGGPTAAQRATIERRGLASPVGARGTGGKTP